MQRRQGFTITELLVAFALIMFIMVILTEAFSAGLESFRQLKAIGDMQEKMRAVSILMRRDLRAEHFDNKDNRGNKLSDIDLRIDPITNLSKGSPPDEGYFRIWQRSNPNDNNPSSLTWNSTRDATNLLPTPSAREGLDNANIPITIATDHVIAFTIKLKGTMPSEFMSTELPRYNTAEEDKLTWQANPPLPPPVLPNFAPGVPFDIHKPGVMQSQWAEVIYFLRRKEGRTAFGTQLYSLYRRIRLLAHPGVVAELPVASPREYMNVSLSADPGATAGTRRVNTPSSITEPRNRFGANRYNIAPPPWEGAYQSAIPATANNAPFDDWSLEDQLGLTYMFPSIGQAGDDLLLTDVVAFDIKVLQQGYPVPTGIPIFTDLPPAVPTMPPPTLTTMHNPGFKQMTITPPSGTPSSAYFSVFDTWSKNTNPSAPGSPYYGHMNPATPTPTPGRAYWDGRGEGPPADSDANTNTLQVPLRIRIIALQITIRVWDEKTEQTRQVTLIQDM